jgi:hypothetical protein
VSVFRQRHKTGPSFAIAFASLAGLLILAGQSLAQTEIKAVKVEPSAASSKAAAGKQAAVQVKVQERPVTGILVGHPFALKKAVWVGTSIVLEGGDVDPSNSSKGQSKITIEFPPAQDMPNQTYQIRYNSVLAFTGKGETKAPKVTYTSIDKSGAVVNVVAANGSKADEQDYAMDLRLSPVNKKGQLPGFVKLQIGSNPVSDIKGNFCASK